MLRMTVAALLMLLVVAPTNAAAASFDCRQVRTADEIAICGNRELNDLDVRMATLYEVTTGFVAMGQRGAMRDEQREWLAQRHVCRADVRCLRRSYRQRIVELEGVVAEIKSRGPF